MASNAPAPLPEFEEGARVRKRGFAHCGSVLGKAVGGWVAVRWDEGAGPQRALYNFPGELEPAPDAEGAPGA